MTHLRRFQHVLRALLIAAFAFTPGQASGQTAPTNFAAALDANVHNTINLSWTAEATQTYSIEWVVQTAAAHPGWSGATEIDVSGAGTSTYKHTGLQSAQVYWYRIKACSDATTCTDYPTATTAGGLVATANTGRAPRPSNFAAAPKAGSHTEITLTWTGLSTLVYQVQWVEGATLASWPEATAGNTLQIPQGGAAAHTYTHTGLKQGTKYWYRIRVCDPGYTHCLGWRALDAVTGSHVASATTTVPAAPTAPTDFAAARDANVHNTINLSWTAEATQTYRIEWVSAFGVDPHPGWSGATEISLAAGTDGYEHARLRSNHRHWYRIRACDSAGTTCTDYPTATAATDPQVATALTGAPPNPTGFGAAPKSGSHTEITLTWTGLATQTYEIHWVEGATLASWPEATAGKVLQIPQGGAAAHTYTHTGLKQGTKYWYRIRVCDPGHIGCIAWAALNAVTGNHVASATTTAPNVPADPTNFAAATTTNATHSTITLSWTGVAEQSYKVQWTTGTTPTWPALGTNELEIDQDAAAHSYEHAGRDASTQYWYRIRACNASFADCKDYPTATTAGGLVQTATTDAAPTNQLPKPTGLSAQTRLAASGGVSVQWRQRTGTASWQIRWNTSGWDQQYPPANTLTSTYPTGTDIKAPRLTPGVGYYFQVRALTGTGTETASDWADVRGLQGQITTAVLGGGKLGAITGFTAETGTAETGKYGIVLTWDEHVGAEAFTVERSPNGTGSWETLTGTVSLDQGSHRYRDNDVFPAATHHYRVTATHSNARISNSDASAVQQATAPSVPDPTGLDATANGTTQIDLTWNGRTADQHKINFGTETGANWDIGSTNVVTVPAGQLTYSHKTLTPGTTYYYRIIACVVGEGDEVCSTWPANTADVTVEGDMASAATQLAAPANFVATGVSGGVDLTWDAVAGVTYNLQWRESDAGAWTSLADTTGGSYRHAGLEGETTYYYQIRAASSATSTNPSDWVGGDATTLQLPPPDKPTGLTATTNTTEGGIDLSWGAVSGTEYNLQWTDEPPEESDRNWRTLAEGIGETTYKDRSSGLIAGTTYYYQVQAETPDGRSSDWSDEASAAAGAPPPPVPTAPTNFAANRKSGVHNTITLSWDAESALTYRIEWVEGVTHPGWSGATEIAVSGAGTDEYDHTGLSSASVYWYRIKACSDGTTCTDYPTATTAGGLVATATTGNAPRPSNFAAAPKAGSHTEITLTWTGLVTQVYRVQWVEGATLTSWPSANASNVIPIPQGGAAAHTYTHTGRKQGTKYWYRIAPCDPGHARCLDWRALDAVTGSHVASATTTAPTRVPADPTNFAAATTANATHSTITLSWTGVAEQSYKVQWTTGTTPTWPAPGTNELEIDQDAAAHSHEHAGRDASTQYWYRIRACNASFADCKDYPAATTAGGLVQTATTDAAPTSQLAAPAVTVSFGGRNADDRSSVSLSWAPVGDATGYAVQRQVGTSGWSQAPGKLDTQDPAEVSYLEGAANLGDTTQTHHYRVKATAPNFTDSEWWVGSQSWNLVSTPVDPPTAVQGFTAAAGRESVTLSWTAYTGAGTKLEIEYNTTGADAGTWTRIQAEIRKSATSYKHTGLTAGTTYWYRIRAVGDSAHGPWSGALSAKPAAAPTGDTTQVRSLTATGGSKQIVLSWTRPRGSHAIAHYEIEWKASGGNYSGLASTTATTYTNAGLSDGESRTYRVAAVSTANRRGTWSPEASATTTAGTAAPKPPGAPRDLRARAGTMGITVTWDAPEDTGSAAITSYFIDSSSDGVTWSLLLELGNVTEYTHAGLSPAQTVHYRVRAKNSVGTGPWSASVSATVQGRAPSAPGAPLNLVATVTGRTVQLTWQQPADTGTAAITAYRIEMSTNGGTNWASLSSVDGTTTLFTHMGTMAGRQYHYRIVATNRVGDSPPSNIAMAQIAVDPPSQPRNLTVRPAPSSAVLTWTAPRDDGGGEITGYRIEMQHPGGWATLVNSIGPGNTTYTATGLQPGANVAFRVFAINDGGESPASNIASVTIPIERPDPPSTITAIAVSSTVIAIAWNPPDSNGGSPITSYRLEYSTDGSYWRPLASNVSGTSNGYTHRRLDPGTLYYYRAYAINKVGRSEASPTVEVTTFAEPPGEPTGLSATTISPTQIDLAWRAPETDGGARVTGYRIEVSADSRQWTVLSTETGLFYSHVALDPATTYYYRVFALNEAGESPASRVASAQTKADVPGRPTDLVATVADRTVQLTWRQPSDTGTAAITAYRIEMSTNGGTSWASLSSVGGTINQFTHMGATAGQQYHYRIVATNNAGDGPPSNVASVTIPIERPDPPSAITAVAVSSTVISIGWNPPVSDGGSPITSYGLEYSTDGSYWRPLASDVSGTSTGYTHRRLEPGTLYHYRAYAINRAGRSDASPTAEATTLAEPPGEPTGLSASTISPTRIDLAWRAPDTDGGARVSGYRIEVSADSRQWAVLSTAADLFYSHTDLDPATTYYYRVFALNRVGESPASHVASAQTTADVPGRPTDLAATARSHDRIELLWAAPRSDGGARVTGYMIESSSDDGASWEVLQTNTGTSTTAFTHEDLEAATTYHYRVSAINDVGVGESSEQAHARTHALPPSAPRDLVATPLTGTQIGLEWRPPKTDGGSDIIEYLLEVSDNEFDSWERLREVEGDVLEYTHRVTPGMTYYYRVFAINEVGRGPASDVASAVTDDTPERTERVTQAILPRFAAASVQSAVEAISLRVQTVPRGIGSSSNINLANGRSEDLRALANGQSVSQTSGRLSIWGAAGLIGLNDESKVTWNGDVLNFHGGMDGMLRDNVLVGIGGTRSDGAFTFMDQTGGNDHEGEFEADMTLVTPYLGWIQDRASMWATMGFGRGSMTITDAVAERSSDVTARFIAGGGSTRIAGTRLGALNLMIEGWNGDVDVVGNGSTGPKRIEESGYRLRRGRLMLEWQAHTGRAGAYQTEAALRGGARYDRNSLDTGVSGAEFSGVVKLAGPSVRTLAKGRMFFPGGAAYSEWGIQAMIEIRSDEHRGLAMQFAPSYGAAEDGIQRLWSQGVMHGVQRPAQGRLNTTLSFDLPSGVTPYWRFGLQDRTRSVFAGFRYAPLEGFSLRSEAVRQDGRNGLSLRGLWHH